MNGWHYVVYTGRVKLFDSTGALYATYYGPDARERARNEASRQNELIQKAAK